MDAIVGTSFGFLERYPASNLAVIEPADTTMGAYFKFIGRNPRVAVANLVDAIVGASFEFIGRYSACRVDVADLVDATVGASFGK